MSFALISNRDNEEATEIDRTGKAGTEAHDPFRSFWLGYSFTINPKTRYLTIGEGYAAVYCSHPSSQERTGLSFDPGASVSLTIQDEDKSTLELRGLTYLCRERIDTGNQAMQLYLFRFARTDGVQQWFDDGGWVNTFDQPPNMSPQAQPQWKRTLDYEIGTPRYVYSAYHLDDAWQQDGGSSTRAFGVAMPLLNNSLFGKWLAAHGSTNYPTLSLAAKGESTGDDPDAVAWTVAMGGPQIQARQAAGGGGPRGVACIAQGAFLSLQLDELLSEAWIGRLQPNNEYDLLRELGSVISRGSPRPHSLGELADLSSLSVVEQSNRYAQEFFTLRLS